MRAARRCVRGGRAGGKLFSLPNVGHGYAVPRNWETQFLQAYDVSLRTARALHRSRPRLKSGTALSEWRVTERAHRHNGDIVTGMAAGPTWTSRSPEAWPNEGFHRSAGAPSVLLDAEDADGAARISHVSCGTTCRRGR